MKTASGALVEFTYPKAFTKVPVLFTTKVCTSANGGNTNTVRTISKTGATVFQNNYPAYHLMIGY